VLSARSLGGIALLSGVLYGVRFAHGVKRPIVFLAAAAAMVVVVIAAQQTMQENPDKMSSNIERTSMIETAAESFISSPIVGQGTWYASSKMMRHIEQHRMDIDPKFHGYSEEEAKTLTIHSQILTALAEAGILGGAFFIAYGALILKTIRTLTKYPVPHRAFVLYLLVDGLWNLCMSPFSGASRVSISLVVCASLLVILQRQDELSDYYRE
jgi:O-antigen ligase